MEKSCKSCWWQEGGRCYIEPVDRNKKGQSNKLATCLCNKYDGKREMLSKVIPNEKLIILSELNEE